MSRLGMCSVSTVIGLLALCVRTSAEEKTVKFPDFLSKAMEWTICEKSLAETAAKSASREDVRKFAQSMAADHANYEKELGEVVKDKKIAVASVPDKAERDKNAEIAKLKGEDFDRKFLARVIETHERALKWLDEAAKGADDEKCRANAKQAAESVRKHLEEARDLQKKVGR